MAKWLALLALFFAFIALTTSADERKVRDEFDRMKARLEGVEHQKCTLMAVTTPSGVTSICALQP